MSYSFTGDDNPVFIHLSFLSLFNLHLIQQSLLHKQAAHEENILSSRNYKQCLANTGISTASPLFRTLYFPFVVTLIFDGVESKTIIGLIYLLIKPSS